MSQSLYHVLQKLFHCFLETLSTFYLDSLWQSLKTSMTLIRTSLWTIVYFESRAHREAWERYNCRQLHCQTNVSFAEMQEDLQKLGWGVSKPKLKSYSLEKYILTWVNFFLKCVHWILWFICLILVLYNVCSSWICTI